MVLALPNGMKAYTAAGTAHFYRIPAQRQHERSTQAKAATVQLKGGSPCALGAAQPPNMR